MIQVEVEPYVCIIHRCPWWDLDLSPLQIVLSTTKVTKNKQPFRLPGMIVIVDIYALFHISDFICFQQYISTFQPGASFSAAGSAGAGGTSGSTGASTGGSTGGTGGSSGRSGSTTGSTAGARSGDPGVLRRGMLWQEVKGMQKAHWMKYADFNKLLWVFSGGPI